MRVSGSGDPFSFDVREACQEEADAEGSEEGQVEGERHGVPAMHGPVQYIHTVGEGQGVGERLQEDRKFLDGKEKPAEEDHGKTEEVGKGLRLEYLADGDGYEKPEEGFRQLASHIIRCVRAGDAHHMFSPGRLDQAFDRIGPDDAAGNNEGDPVAEPFGLAEPYRAAQKQRFSNPVSSG